MKQTVTLFVGTYTAAIAPDLEPVPGTTAVGLYVYSFDPETAYISQSCSPVPSVNPSFLVSDRSGRTVYAVNEVATSNGVSGGTVSAFTIDAGASAVRKAYTVPSGDAGPCHIAMDAKGANLLVSNFLGGSLARIPVHSDGPAGKPEQIIRHQGASVHPTMQTKAHAHMAITDPVTGLVYVPDLGSDRVFAYRQNDNGELVSEDEFAIRAAAGAGPRHMDFHPGGRFAYLINQLDSTVTVFSRNEDGAGLTQRQVISTLPQGYAGSNDAADIHVHPTGDFLYASNRGHDSVVIYAIDPDNGTLEWLGHVPSGGKTPRHMAFDPSGEYLFVANHDSDTIGVFRLDRRTGNLEEIQRFSTPAPACIAVVDYRSASG